MRSSGCARRYGKPLDIHLHEPGEMGAFSIELIIERTRALGMAGKVDDQPRLLPRRRSPLWSIR